MDVNGRMLTSLNLWRCENSHVLGVIKKRKVKNSSAKFAFRVTVVFLLRESVDMTKDAPDVVKVAGRTRATPDLSWTCSICGAEQTWEKRRSIHIEREEVDHASAN